MANISVSLPSDGQTIDAADYNTPINTIVSEINGNLDNSNISVTAAIAGTKLADASITNAKLATTVGELGGAWQSWTPTLSNLTLGNGTLTTKYTNVGKTYQYRFTFVLGTTSSVGTSPSFTLPVTAASYGQSGTAQPIIGDVRFEDTGSGAIRGSASLSSNNTTVAILADAVSASYSTMTTVTNSIPFTFGTGDSILITGHFEAA